MQIRPVPCQGAVRLVVQGELDLASAPRLEEATQAIECPDGDLVLDLRAVTFVDSAGLRAILAAGSACAARGRRMVVIEGRPDLERLLCLVGAEQRLELVCHPSQALARLGSPAQAPPAHSLARWSSFRGSTPSGAALSA